MKYKLQLDTNNYLLSKCNLKEGKRNTSIYLFIFKGIFKIRWDLLRID